MIMYFMIWILVTNNKDEGRVLRFAFCSIFAIYMVLIGLRDESLGTDTGMYKYIFERQLEDGEYFNSEWLFYDPVFWFGRLFGSANLLLVPAFMFSWSLWRASKLWAGKHWPILFVFLISGFCFYSCAINVIRSGIAMMFTVCSAYYALNENKWSWKRFCLFGLWASAACAVHVFQFIFIMILLLITCFPKIKFWLPVYVFVVGLVFFGFNPVGIVASFIDIGAILNDRAEGYAFADMAYKTGFRLDFTGFVTLALLFPIYYINVRRYQSLMYRRLVCFYLASSTVFVACSYISFSDRIGLMAFWLIPLLAVVPLVDFAYPFFKQDRLKVLIVAALYGMSTFGYYYVLLGRV